MPKRRIFLFLTALVLICARFGVGLTGAWFVAGGRFSGGDYYNARVEYLPPWENITTDDEVYGTLIDGSTEQMPVFVVPGDELVKKDINNTVVPLSLENFSTTETEVRFVADISVSQFNELTSQDEVITNMQWLNITTATDSAAGNKVYQFGKYTTVGDEQVFMGVVQMTMYDGTYTWNKLVSPESTWSLVLNAGTATETTTIPPLDITQQKYTVVKSIQIVGNSMDTAYQNDFNDYFSQNFAGSKITLSLKYYAKQHEYMLWTQFAESLITLGI